MSEKQDNPGGAGSLPRTEHGMVMTLPPGSLLPDGGLRSPEASLPIGTRLGEFEISGLIGEGGFGIVYLATDHLLGRQVALKEYMPTALASRGSRGQVDVKSQRHAETFEAGRRSFINEARLLAQFDHPALVKVFRFWEANGTAYMVMPFYRGRTLRQALADMGSPPSQAWVQQMLAPLVDALETLHGAQCYHRDIAPDNILLLENGRPVLLDFGAARRVIGDITQALTVILKPGFAPVEQYANGPEMKQGPWTDVYALAAVVYYCATLKTPVPSVSRMMKDTLEPFSRVAGSDYDERFCAAVDKGLAVGVEERIQDMAQFRDALGLAPEAGPRKSELRPASSLQGTSAGLSRSRVTDDDLEATVVDPSAWQRPRAPGPPRPPPPPPPSSRNEEKLMDDASPVPRKNEKPWTPDADVQLARVAAEADASSGKGRPNWLPAAALVLLIGAGAGGYWFWSQAPVDQSGQPGQAPPPSAVLPAAPGPSTNLPPTATPSSPAPAQTPAPAPGLTPAPAAAPSAVSPPPVPSAVPSLIPSLVPEPAPAPAASAGGAPGFDSGTMLPIGQIIDSLHQQRDPQWPVSVQVTSDRVRIGKDRLRFRVRSERDGYVYLLMQGTDRSHFYQLFPNGLDKDNRLRGGVDMALPRSNWEMVAGGPPGLNRFIALVTPTPRNFSGAGLNSSQPFSEFDVQAAARVFADRGAGPFAGEPTGCRQDERTCAAYGSAVFEIEEY